MAGEWNRTGEVRRDGDARVDVVHGLACGLRERVGRVARMQTGANPDSEQSESEQAMRGSHLETATTSTSRPSRVYEYDSPVKDEASRRRREQRRDRPRSVDCPRRSPANFQSAHQALNVIAAATCVFSRTVNRLAVSNLATIHPLCITSNNSNGCDVQG